MLRSNPNGSDWLTKFNRPNVIAKNRHQSKKTNWVARPPLH
jgi:hypothetical protein